MKFNKYMHPRNIYRKPANFKELAITYPEFRKHAQQDLTGKVSIDFKNPAALRALTTALLQKDFGLTVHIPPNRLVPTLPLRLNYLLWIEDLLNAAGCAENVHGIDIGTGAACVYSLIAAKHFGWSMLATEADEETQKCAKTNVLTNKLEDKVEVLKVTSPIIVKDVLEKRERNFHFCMCNPPFFSSEEDKQKSMQGRSNKKPPPTSVQTGATGEVIVEGGEVEFVTQMIRESKELGTKIRIYTSMIGRKTSLAPLKLVLKEVGACQYVETEFCQGRTMRWGLGWTFDSNVTLEPSTKPNRKKERHPSFSLPSDNSITVAAVVERVEQLLKKLKVHFRCIRQTESQCILYVTARENTWTHQRRFRREAKRKEMESPSLETRMREDKENKSKKSKSESVGNAKEFVLVTDLPREGEQISDKNEIYDKGVDKKEMQDKRETDDGEMENMQCGSNEREHVKDDVELKFSSVKNFSPNKVENCTGVGIKTGSIEDVDLIYSDSESVEVILEQEEKERNKDDVSPSCVRKEKAKDIEDIICIDDSNEGLVEHVENDDITIIEMTECSKDSDDVVVVGDSTSRENGNDKGAYKDKAQLNNVEPDKINLKKAKKYYPQCVFQGKIMVTKEDSEIQLNVQYLQGTGGKQAAHQVLQYFRNNLKA